MIRILTLLVLAFAPLASAQTMAGPLRVSTANPRYFTDDSGKAIYLTGAHNWDVMRDSGLTDPPNPFNYDGFLDLISADHHNFLRLWVWDQPKSECDNDGRIYYTAPFPWPRTGPGLGNDGKPKFDLSQLEESYFTRLRSRVIAARDRGIYVGIMLFDGFGLQFCRTENDGNPFDGVNNINGISPAANMFTLNNPAALEVQKAYVRMVVDTVNDLDNVLYEIANEAGVASTAWQYEIINTINEHQATKPRRHPVGMTFQHAGGDNATLFASAADWISPGGDLPGGGIVPYGTDPPAADGSKVILSDTDHLWGVTLGASPAWVWRSFTRGLNTLYMNPINDHPDHPEVRRAMGQTIDYARRIDLNTTLPRGELTSTSHCLANPGSEYLVYQPSGGTFNVNLGTTAGTYRVEWFKPTSGSFFLGSQITASGRQNFTPPFNGSAVLYLRSTSLPAEESIKINITYPLEGNTYTSTPTSIPVRATATDRYGEILEVEFFAGEQSLGVSVSEPHELTWESVPPGNYFVSARATNSAAATLVSSPVAITVGPLPEIRSLSLDQGIASFLLMGEVGPNYLVQVSEDLEKWDKLIETPLTAMPGFSGGSAVIVDPESAAFPRRYYRARLAP